MSRRRRGGRGVPAGWCVERKTSPKKFARGSFRTACYSRAGKRVKCKDKRAVRGITIGCPKGAWDPKVKDPRFKTRGKCRKGTRVQRVITRPGSYGCPKRKR